MSFLAQVTPDSILPIPTLTKYMLTNYLVLLSITITHFSFSLCNSVVITEKKDPFVVGYVLSSYAHT